MEEISKYMSPTHFTLKNGYLQQNLLIRENNLSINSPLSNWDGIW